MHTERVPRIRKSTRDCLRNLGYTAPPTCQFDTSILKTTCNILLYHVTDEFEREEMNGTRPTQLAVSNELVSLPYATKDKQVQYS